ncbi:MAG: 4Fe-4S binding protein [Candidatus Fermentibacteraceae bacterium]|nr:4Fe-4S binding protein [Candidatus Fermentibacteraceae bacterium]
MRKKGIFVLVLVLLAAIAAVASGGTRFWVEADKCSGCGDCLVVCPVNAITIEDGKSHIDPDACINCGLCQGVCTYDAIH